MLAEFALAGVLALHATPKSPPEPRKLVTARPSREVQNLWNNLNAERGKRIFSGQCDDKYRPFIISATGGKEPAIMGYDFNGVPPSQGTNKDAAKAIAWAKRGGIVTFQWHWISPNTDGDFYTDKFRLDDALADPKSTSYKNLVRDLELVALELKKLQAAKVPVIWRQLHEAEGKWFWWGKSGGDACKKLYRLMFDRYTKKHRLNNLIWTWTSYGKEKENWFPGDDVVDLVVRDYETPKAYSDYEELFADKGYIFGLGEEGKLPDPETLKERPWVYFLTWAYMIEDKQKGNTPEWISRVYNDPRVITLSDLQKAK